MANLASMSVDALLRLREDVGRALTQRAEQLKTQLSQLGDGLGHVRGRRSPMKGRKVPVKFRDKEGNTWAGRGAQPRWLRDRLKSGAKLQDFAVRKSVAARRASARKTKKRRKTRR
jgi:DNA-binding protein H-NS